MGTNRDEQMEMTSESNDKTQKVKAVAFIAIIFQRIYEALKF